MIKPAMIELTFLVDITGMIDYINTMPDALLHRVPGTSVSAESATELMSLINACCCFFVLEVAVLCRPDLCYLKMCQCLAPQ